MGYKLFIFIEGDDDERFFNKIIIPMFENKYDSVKLWKYAQEKNEKILQFLNSINAMKADYIFVVREIEGWYLAGMDDVSSGKIGIKSFHNTEHINKSAFNDLKPKKFNSRIDFMSEILKLFCIDTAKMKNRSFSYFTVRISKC